MDDNTMNQIFFLIVIKNLLYRYIFFFLGNALGYVRMIHSGGLHHSIASMTYFPFNDFIGISENNKNDMIHNTIDNFEVTLFNALYHLNGETDALKVSWLNKYKFHLVNGSCDKKMYMHSKNC